MMKIESRASRTGAVLSLALVSFGAGCSEQAEGQRRFMSLADKEQIPLEMMSYQELGERKYWEQPESGFSYYQVTLEGFEFLERSVLGRELQRERAEGERVHLASFELCIHNEAAFAGEMCNGQLVYANELGSEFGAVNGSVFSDGSVQFYLQLPQGTAVESLTFSQFEETVAIDVKIPEGLIDR